MMSRKLRKSEIALILALTVVLLGLIYYQFIFRYVQNAEGQYDTTNLMLQIQQEEQKARKIEDMQAEIDKNKGNESGEVATYDNLKNEINALNDIFSDAESFNFTFSQATASGTTVRRVINASFTAADYQTAKTIIENLHNCQYRCLITDIAVTSAGTQGGSQSYTNANPNLNADRVSATLSVTFFETLYDATTTDGIQVKNSSTTTNGDRPLTDILSKERQRYESMGAD